MSFFQRTCAFRGVFLAAALVLSLTSCELTKNQLTYDRPAEKDRQDYRDVMAPMPVPQDQDAAIPDFAPVVATPEELKLPSPLVTVSVNNTVSLRDLLFELAEQADVDLELDPQIRGSLIFTAKDRPFDEVVSRICDMAGLRYTFEKNVLRIEIDRPYLKNYDLDYVNIARQSSSTMSAGVQLGGGSDAGTSSSGGSKANIDGKYDTDIWDELEKNIEQILTSSDTYVSLATLADPVSTVTPVLPAAPAPVDPNDPSSVPPPLPGSPQVSQMAPTVAPTLNVAAGAAEDPLVPNPPATYSLSKQSGLLSVFASDRQQKAVKKYIDAFHSRVTTQVLIEAKVLQVELNDEYATGINWSDINLFDRNSGNLSFDFTSPGLDAQAAGGAALVFKGGDISAAIRAISRFGTVRALSSPRITVLNNQPALINVAQNKVYFSFDVQTEDDQQTNQKRNTIDSEQKTAVEGVVMNVLPSANPKTGEILLSLRPTVSRITGTVADPTIPFSLASQGLVPDANTPQNNIPEVAVQELDSMLKLQSGQVVVMGGLMRDSNNITDNGVPVLGDLPYVGNLFKNHVDNASKSELVILIRARIIPGSGADDMDRKIYNNFSQDRRPVKL